jgi:hypothetical protein
MKYDVVTEEGRVVASCTTPEAHAAAARLLTPFNALAFFFPPLPQFPPLPLLSFPKVWW